MLNFLNKLIGAKPAPKGQTVTFKLDGMHCTSCSLTVDDTLEGLKGVISSATSYAQSKTIVTYQEKKIKPAQLKTAIEELGYRAEIT